MIAKDTNTTISITEPIPQSSFASQNTVNILITGIPDNAELARVQTLVMLDRLVCIIYSDIINLLNVFSIVSATCRYSCYPIQVASFDMWAETHRTSIYFRRNCYIDILSFSIRF